MTKGFFVPALVWALLIALFPLLAGAHGLTITKVLASFDQPGVVEVRIDLDFSNLLPSAEVYHEFSLKSEQEQRQTIDHFLPQINASIQFFVGSDRLVLELRSFSVAKMPLADFQDPAKDKFTVLKFTAALPPSSEPLRLYVPYGAKVDYPVAFTAQIPAAAISDTSWLEDGFEDSEPFDWASSAPRVAAAGLTRSNPTEVAAPGSGEGRRPWYRELGTYLRLGFHHIVPEGADHILFVLGLFFLGITWRKLLAQTTVFTVAHATTLFLSSYGIFSLPSRIVEPLIALSIAFIALENIFRPRLGIGRLAVVFAFGLIHGLGFASSLGEIEFPRHEFVLALLGFNFGVDLGQLFVITLAFLLVGWFRHRPWFRGRIAVPCSLAIAAIGVFWCGQRVIFYATHR